MTLAEDDDNEVTLQGHKLFVSRGRHGIAVEAVTDERPVTRMTFELTDADAEEIAGMLNDAAGAER